MKTCIRRHNALFVRLIWKVISPDVAFERALLMFLNANSHCMTLPDERMVPPLQNIHLVVSQPLLWSFDLNFLTDWVWKFIFFRLDKGTFFQPTSESPPRLWLMSRPGLIWAFSNTGFSSSPSPNSLDRWRPRATACVCTVVPICTTEGFNCCREWSRSHFQLFWTCSATGSKCWRGAVRASYSSFDRNGRRSDQGGQWGKPKPEGAFLVCVMWDRWVWVGIHHTPLPGEIAVARL